MNSKSNPVRFAETDPREFLASVGEELARAWLNPDELARAARFHRDQDRDLFVAAHAFWRRCLAEEFGCEPADLIFQVGPHGKPFVVDPPVRDFDTNLSHTRDRIAVAIAWGGRVGIDVEAVDRKIDPAEIAPRVFAPEEIIWMNSPSDRVEQRDRFFRLWTLKESYAKALGVGFGIDFAAHRFLPPELGGWRLVRAPKDSALRQEWSYREECLPSGHRLAICVEA